MKMEVLASTKIGYTLPVTEARYFSGKEAGICYMPDTIETLFSEPNEKSLKRSNGTEVSGHHSVFAHPQYNFSLEEIPKILAIVLNNEKVYKTSEKSARYTKMQASAEEQVLYEKWLEIYEKRILSVYPEFDLVQAKKLAQENARYLISVFTPATSMGHTLDFRQLNYILHWCDNYVQKEPSNEFSKQLKPVLSEFTSLFAEYKQELLSDGKDRKLSLFSERERKEEWGENYCCNYMATFSQFAQAHRHRTLNYEISIPTVKDAIFFVPYIIRGTDLEATWLEDIRSLANRYPQGMLVKVNERGTAENFILKCKERLCGCAQLEIAVQTSQTLKRYLDNVKDTNIDVYNYLLEYSKGARCTFKNFKCAKPCRWGAKEALTRMI